MDWTPNIRRSGRPTQKIIDKMTIGDALAIFQDRQKNATEIKDGTKAYNKRAAEDLFENLERSRTDRR